jgi:hypothetical protein
VMVIALSIVQLAPVQGIVRAPGKKIGGTLRGLEEKEASPPTATEFTAQEELMQNVPVASGSVYVRFAVADGVNVFVKPEFIKRRDGVETPLGPTTDCPAKLGLTAEFPQVKPKVSTKLVPVGTRPEHVPKL